MNRGLKIALISLGTIGVGAGIYFTVIEIKRNRLIDDLSFGSKVPYVSNKSGKQYDLEKGDKGLIAYKDGIIKGQYWLIDGEPYWVTSKEKKKIKLTHKKDIKYFKRVLPKLGF